MKIRPAWTGLLLTLIASTPPLRAQVAINEIFYHAPDDLSALQWVELHNTTSQPVDLSGWRLAKGGAFTFGPGSTLAAHGYVVLCQDRNVFAQFYSAPVMGEFEKALKPGGGRLELRDRGGRLIDGVTFDDRAPWPLAADGQTASLERICPTESGDDPGNWQGSPLGDVATRPGGTPGEKNAAFSATRPPSISQVLFPTNALAPQQPILVRAKVESKAPLKEVSLLYRVVRPGKLGDEQVLSMNASGADSSYQAEIPAPAVEGIIRFRIRALDQNGAERIHPAPTEPRPAFSCLLWTNVAPGRVPLAYLVHADAAEAERALRQTRRGGGGQGPEGMGRFMAQMQFRAALDLPALWAALTLSNTTPDVVEAQRPVFARLLAERTALEEKVLVDADPEEIGKRLPDLLQPLKTSVQESLKPILTPEQTKAFETWRGGPVARPMMGGPGGDPATMLRQFIPLEPAYLHLATRTNVSASQVRDLSDVYRDAIRRRDALVPDLARLMAGRPGENETEGQQFQRKAMAIPGEVEERIKKLLTSAQIKEFAAWQFSEQPPFARRGGDESPEPARGQSAFVVVDPVSREPRLFDFVHIPQRSGGWKVHFAKGDSWNGMTAINLVFEAGLRWLLSESLAYDLHRRAGLVAPRSEFVRLVVDGEPVPLHLLIEQPNQAFLRHHGLHDDGNLYKATWNGEGIEGTHLKRTHRHAGHEDLVRLVEALEKSKDQPEEQWQIIRRQFATEDVINHYAVRMLISDWDGFFNNYYLYHDVSGTRKWTFFPWDEDKTWGEYDGWEQNGPLYEMPLSYGSEGDHPPGEPGGRPSTSYGFRDWWRAGGCISRPLLANPVFRGHFLARLKELLDTEFTEDRIGPLVDALKARLEEEVRNGAGSGRPSPDEAVRRLDTHLASYKEFVTRRRAFLLSQPEVKAAGPFRRSEIR